MKSVEKQELTEESNRVWKKIQLFKQRYNENANKLKSLEQDLTKAKEELSKAKEENASKLKILGKNLTKAKEELSKAKEENDRLSTQLKLKQSSLNQFQQIGHDLVVIEDKYRTLLLEKKKTDESLDEHKKLCLAHEKQKQIDMNQLQESLQAELRTLREHAASNEKNLELKYTTAVKEQKEEIEALKLKFTSVTQQVGANNAKIQYQAEITKLKQDLDESRKRTLLHQKLIDNRERNAIDRNDSQRPRKKDRNQGPGVIDIYSFQEETNEPEASDSIQMNPRIPRLPSKRAQDPLTATEAKTRPDSANPSQSQGGKTESSALEVFRIPSRIVRKKAPIQRKRKLYTRNDDLI